VGGVGPPAPLSSFGSINPEYDTCTNYLENSPNLHESV
jgi:hypothetical protein